MTDERPTQHVDGWQIEIDTGDTRSAQEPSTPSARVPGESLLNAAEAELDKFGAAFDEQLEAMNHITAALGNLTQSATSGDNHVRVIVDNTGLLTGLDISPEAMNWSPDSLAERILTASQEATIEVEQRVADTRVFFEQMQKAQQARSKP